MPEPSPVRSRLYECRVMHHRFSPKRHGFSYRVFYLALDLDELPALHRRLRLFSFNRGNLYSVRERDHFPVGDETATLRERITTHLSARGLALGRGRIELITLPRTLGYLFNPVSFYFCFSENGRPLAAIAEVTNTFREVKPYFLGHPEWRDGAFHLRVPKYFYVSPFSDVDVSFDFTLRPPGETMAIRIDDFTGDQRTLMSTITGAPRALTDARLACYLLKFPLLTLRVITLIHWHALRLFLKRVPWFAKAARASEQRGVLRPHHSLPGTSRTHPVGAALAPSLPPYVQWDGASAAPAKIPFLP